MRKNARLSNESLNMVLGVLAKILGTVVVLGACAFAALFMLSVFENPTSTLR